MNFTRFRGRPKPEEESQETAQERYKKTCQQLRKNQYCYENTIEKQNNKDATDIDEANEIGG